MIFLARNEAVKNFMQNHAAISELALKFVGGKDVFEAVEKSLTLQSQGRKASLFYLGEYVEDFSVINQTVSALKAIVRNLATAKLDVYVSVDPTQIGYQIDADMCCHNAFEIAKEIKEATTLEKGSSTNFLMLDMEDSSVTEATINLYEALTDSSLPAAITLQAYLYRTESDMQKIVGKGGAVRLVKGAFAEGKDIAFTSRSMIDGNFMRLAAIMLSDEARRTDFYPIFATHDETLIEAIIELASKHGWEKKAYEFEMLYGVKGELQEKLIKNGEQLRLYLPFGTEWWSYTVRRIGENPKNVKFLLRSLVAS